MKEGFKKTLATVGATAILATNAAKATAADLLAKIKDKKINLTEKVADNTRVATTDLKMVMAHNDKNVWTKNPEYFGGNGEPIFAFKNGKLVVVNDKFSAKVQPVLDKFYNLKNQELITLTEKGIVDILGDDELKQEEKNNLIRIFLQAALGDGEMHYRSNKDGIHKTNFEKIRAMAGNPAHLDKDGNISETEQILQKIIEQATKVSLNELMQNPTFGANWNDAERLDGKSSELYGRKTLNDDEKTMLAMDEYRRYKEFPKNRIPDANRAFLASYNNDISYMDPNKLTDEFVASEYLRIMEEYENLFQTTAQLNPGHKIDDEAFSDANDDWD